MSFGKRLPCGLCSKKVSIEEENFPEDLFNLLLQYSVPRLYWICKSCDKEYFDHDSGEICSLKEQMKLLTAKLENVEFYLKKFTNPSRDVASDDESFEPVCNFDHSTPDTSGCQDSDYSSTPDQSSNKSACSSTPPSIDQQLSSFGDESPKKNNKVAHYILDELLKNKIKIDPTESAKNSNLVTEFLKNITLYFKSDPVFRRMYSRDYKTGSSYNELRISHANEYDIEFVFKPPPRMEFEFEFFSETLTFAKLKWKISGNVSPEKDILQFFEKNSKNGYLKTLKISAWFHSLIDKYLKCDIKIQGIKKMRNSQSGPARTIEIETDEGYNLSIDLLPAFIFSSEDLKGTELENKFEKYPVENSKKFWFLVSKKCKGEVKLYASDLDFSWRVHFPEVEKKVLYNKLCAKNVIKLLKLLRDKEDWKIASYHMVTVILWAIDKNPKIDYWQGSFLFDRYVEALDSLQNYLENRRLPYFMDNSYNLFHELHEDLCANISNRLKIIIKEITSDPNYLSKIYS